MEESLFAISVRWLGFVVLAVAVLAWFIGWIRDKIG
jgi:hypothetical protein